MSVSSAMNTAVSGLTAQSVLFSNISNNISNSGTVGYKATDTSFSDYVEASGALEGQSGNVIATTQYANQTTGPITASVANGALAINGNGFFAVNEISGTSSTNAPSFSNTQYYTRAGDFSSDKNGYLVNSAGEYLDGYMANASGVLNTSALTPINVAGVAYRPTATSNVTVAPNLANVSTVQTSAPQTVYDNSGVSHTLNLSWTQAAAPTASSGGTYTLDVAGTTPAASASVVFNTDGTMQSLTPSTPAGAAVSSGAATFNIGPVTAGGSPITLGLGTINSPGSGTQMSTTGQSFSSGIATQDGTAAGAGTQTGFAMQTDGSVVATFSTGETQLIGKVPLATFGNANALQAHDGQAYTATSASGTAAIQMAATGAAGGLVTKSVEGSTTSLDTDLTKLIVAQQAYGASAKVVTTAEQMLQTALSMKQ